MPVGNEGDAASVRRPGDLAVVRVAEGQLLGLAALDGNGPDVLVALDETASIESVAQLGQDPLVGYLLVGRVRHARLAVRFGPGEESERAAVGRPRRRGRAELLARQLPRLTPANP